MQILITTKCFCVTFYNFASFYKAFCNGFIVKPILIDSRRITLKTHKYG